MIDSPRTFFPVSDYFSNHYRANKFEPKEDKTTETGAAPTTMLNRMMSYAAQLVLHSRFLPDVLVKVLVVVIKYNFHTCVSVKLSDFASCFRSAPTTYLE